MTEDSRVGLGVSETPLAGRTIVVTRTLDQSAALAEPLIALGATVIAFPVIQTVDPEDWGPADAAIASIDEYDWIVFSSTNAVDRFAARLERTGLTIDSLDPVKYAVVGSGTARRLAEYGIQADLVPRDFRGEGLVAAFEELGAGAGWRILIPGALQGRKILQDSLRAMGAQVDVAPLYQTVRAQPLPAAIEPLRTGALDAVTFTSPSTFKQFVVVVDDAGIDAGALIDGVVTASIGPVTSDAMRAHGHEPTTEAVESSIPGLVLALSEVLGSGTKDA